VKAEEIQMSLMKSLSILAVFIMSNTIAYAGEVLRCTGGIGGPQPASVILRFDQNADGSTLIHAILTNPNFPDGVSGELTAQGDVNLGVVAQGTLGKIPVVFQLESISAESENLSIGAGWNHLIEFGYGAHFGCAP
jgi:hypothetical protein